MFTSWLPQTLDRLVGLIKPIHFHTYQYHPYFILTDIGRFVCLGITYVYLRESTSFPFRTFLGVFLAVFVIYKLIRDGIKGLFTSSSRSFLQDTVLIILPTYYILVRWIARADTAEAFDVVALIAPIYLFFSRLGCFFSGCCYGLPSPVGVYYGANHFQDVHGCRHFKAAHRPQSRVLPTQLLEAFLSLLIGLGIQYLLFTHQLKPGSALGVYFLAYCPVRFGLDFLRVSSVRPRYGRFSEAQVFCILIVALVWFIV